MKDFIKLLLVAAFLLGGYIAYDQWRGQNDCAVLARQFEINLKSVIGSGVIEEAEQEGTQLPMIGVADKVADNTQLMNQLDAQCIGWREGKYY